MEQTVATTQDNGRVLESVILKGDISGLSPIEKVQYYKSVCDSVGLNPLTQPLAYIVLNGKSTLYAKRDATDQLRKIHKVSVTSCKNERVEDVYIVTVGVQDGAGRTDMGTGAVSIGNLKGDALANALMKAETKAKRRATLSICGLGLLDETELETIHDKPKAQPVAQRIAAMLHPVSDMPEPLSETKPPVDTEEHGVPSLNRDLESGTEVSQFQEPAHDLEAEAAFREFGEAIGNAPTLKVMYKHYKNADKSTVLSIAQKRLLWEQQKLREKAEGWHW